MDRFHRYLNDRKLDKSGGTLTGSLDMSGEKITSVGDPTDNKDAATKEYVDYKDAVTKEYVDALIQYEHDVALHAVGSLRAVEKTDYVANLPTPKIHS